MYCNQAFGKGIISDKKWVIKPDHIIIISPVPEILAHLIPIMKQTQNARHPNQPTVAKRYLWTGW
jgi:hypothetical protein